MATLWFILVGFMLDDVRRCSTASTSARVPSISSLAQDDDERRTILRAIGPVWDGNEVWLIAAGGTLFFTFPAALRRRASAASTCR